MALKRISDNEEFLSTYRIVGVLLRNLGDITVRSSLTDYCFKLSDSLLLAQAKFLSEIKEKKDIFYTSSEVLENQISLLVVIFQVYWKRFL